MTSSYWCEHLEIISKYTFVKHNVNGKEVFLKVQTWLCPECGVHGAKTEISESAPPVKE